MALDKAMNTARFGARKAKEVYAVEGLSGVMRRTRAWRRKQRAAAAAAPTLPHGPLPQRPTWHQHVLCVAERSLPQCYHYRVQQKREICAHLGIPFDDVGLDDLGEVLTRMQLASMVIVYRLPGGPALDRVLEEARRLRIPVVYEVDDLVYRRDVTAANPNLDTLPKGLRSAVIRGSDGDMSALLGGEYNLASTAPLSQDMARANGRRSFVVENGIDATMMEIAEGLRVEPRSPAHPQACEVVYGSGSRAHDQDFALAAPAVARWLDATPAGRLTIIGPVRIPDVLQRHADRTIRVAETLAYGEYLRQLHGAAIALAPLTPDFFNLFKSQVKYLEAALVGVPVIASPTVYSSYIDHERTGLIADTEADWLNALTRLSADPALRVQLAAAARDHVRQWELPNRPAQQMAELVASLSPDRAQETA